MVMGLLGRRTVASGQVLFVFALFAGCGGINTDGQTVRPPRSRQTIEQEALRVMQPCPTFRVDTKQFRIRPQAETIPLGGGNFLIIPDNAVPVAGNYEVAPIAEAGVRLAGLRIDAVGSATSDFSEPVELQINYAGCPFEGSTRRFTVVKKDAQGKPNLGGAKSHSRKIMRVLIGGLTEFAIAI